MLAKCFLARHPILTTKQQLSRRWMSTSQRISALGKRYRGLLSFESRFQIPNTDMEQPQYLARGSALLLERIHPKTGDSMAGIVTSRHNAHPFATPFYYPEAASWLSHVKPEHCTFFVSLIGMNGPVWEMELDRELLNIHETLDLCMFQLPTSESCWFLEELGKLNEKSFLSPAPLRARGDEFAKFANVECVGFDYSSDREEDRVSANRFVSVKGRILSSELENGLRRKVDSDGSEIVMAKEFRVESEMKLQFGMCGGPVVMGHDPSHLLGVIEGIDSVNGIVHCLPASTMWGLFNDNK